MTLGDRYSHNRLPYIPQANPDTQEQPSVTDDAEQIIEEARETRELGARAVDETINKIANGERVEMAPENWGLGEYVADGEAIVDDATTYLAGEDKN